MLGKHSGRAALADRAAALGYHLTGEQLQTVFEQFKTTGRQERRKSTTATSPRCASSKFIDVPETWTLRSSYNSQSRHRRANRRSRSRLKHGDRGTSREEMTAGDGPVDAIFLAIEKITGVNVRCRDFRVHSVTVGKDAQGEVNVEIEHDGQVYRGRGVSTDSVEASAQAFLNAINRITGGADERLHPQHSV